MNATPNPKIASLTWKIDNFSTLPREFIKSPSFSPPSNRNVSFYMNLFPKVKFDYSAKIYNEQIVILLMKLQTPDSHIGPSVQYSVSLVNGKGEKHYTTVKQTILDDPDSKITLSHGVTYHCSPVVKPESGFLTDNGTLTIYCEVEIIDYKMSHIVECCNSMAQDYGSLLESSKLSDVVLVVGGHELKAHKLILSARSKVFAAMFEHDCDEKRNSRVVITDVDKEVLDDLLRFIYTGKVESLDQHAADLLIAADKYQLDQLKSICTHHLIAHLTPESVAPTLVLADMHQATELKDKCIEYITKQDDIKLADWKKICESNLELAHSLFQHSLRK